MTENQHVFQKHNFTTQVAEGSLAHAEGRPWVEKDLLLFSSSESSLRAGGTRQAPGGTSLDRLTTPGLGETQQGRMSGTSQGQLGRTEQTNLNYDINYSYCLESAL